MVIAEIDFLETAIEGIFVYKSSLKLIGSITNLQEKIKTSTS